MEPLTSPVLAISNVQTAVAEAEVREFAELPEFDSEKTDYSVLSRSSSQKTVLAGFPFIFDGDTWSDDSGLSSDGSVHRESLTTMETLCATALIDNRMAYVMQDDIMSPKLPKLHRALSHPNFSEADTYMSKDNEHDFGISASGSCKVTMTSGGRGGTVTHRCSLGSAGSSIQNDTVISLFVPHAARLLKPHHTSLISVTQCIFGLDKTFAMLRSASTVTTDLRRRAVLRDLELGVGSIWWRTVEKSRIGVARIATSSCFTLFFMLLTAYALFGPDIVLLCCNSDYDEPFLTLNTIIMLLFLIEFATMSFAIEHYACSIAAMLDLLAIFSLLSDTWFLQSATSVGDSRLVHDTRMARLTRITRVARITRLVPRLIRLFRQQKKTSLARRLLVRRLRRAFQFLDIKGEGLLSSFDFKCFYLTILQECSSLLVRHKQDLLTNDAEILLATAPDGKMERDREANISFEEFTSLFFGTWLGQDVLHRHVEDLENSRGVWAMTSKFTDRTALISCCGLLFLIIVMKLLEGESEELSAKQGLFHLYGLLLAEHRSGPINKTFMCDQIAIYQEDLKVLFLYMDGITWVDYGVSQCPALFHANPFERMDSIVGLAKLRSTEVVKACLPSFETGRCQRDVTVAMSLVDNSIEVKNTIFYASLSIACTILIVMGFILVFSHGITTFSRTTLHPLRALVDDVMALSSVQLVNVDAENPDEEPVLETTQVEELLHLQTSFKSMRNAIRSWSKYVPPSVVQKLFNAGMEATIGVSKLVATILFVDVDGFEDACRGLSPREVNHLLASVFEQIALAVTNNRGTVLEFIGDEVLSVFNTPNAVRSHIHCAVNSALDVHKYVSARVPALMTQDGRHITIRCRCGVHTACILAGNIGSQRRMKYGLLGDGVNLTARLKGLNSRFNTQTIASDKVFCDELSTRRAVFRPLDRVVVKGKTEPTTVYEVMCAVHKGEIPQKIKVAAQKHSEAFKLYQNRKFEDARNLFKEVASELEAVKNRCRLAASEQDLPSRQLRRKCYAYMKKPPGPDWDGVEHLKAKTFDIFDDKELMEEPRCSNERVKIRISM